MARYERVSEIYELLSASQEPVSLNQLCSSLDASTATIKRLVRFLRDELHAPVIFDREGGGYRLEHDKHHSKSIVGPTYDSKELSALLSAHEILDQIPPGIFRRETASLRTRLEKLLYKRPTGHTGLRDRVALQLPQKRDTNEEHFETVVTALATQMRLSIAYKSRSREVDTDRTVSPQRLTFYRSNWYLAAWCHRTLDLRVFALDRISQAAMTPIPSHPVSAKTLSSRLSTAYGIFEGEATTTARLRFTANAARWVADEEWHPKQRLIRCDDGTVELHVPYFRSQELKMDILRFGADVEVLSPKALRQEVADALKAAHQLY
jgi:proteasome accessory factor C